MDSKEIVLKKTFLIIQLVAAAVLMACFWLPVVYDFLADNYLENSVSVIIAATIFVATVLVFFSTKKDSSTKALAISAMIVAAIGTILNFVFSIVKWSLDWSGWYFWTEMLNNRIMPPISLALVILPIVELKKLSMEIKQKNGANGYPAQTYSQPVNNGMIGNYIQPTQMPMNNGMYIDPTREQPINNGMPVNPTGQSYQNDDRNNTPNGIR